MRLATLALLLAAGPCLAATPQTLLDDYRRDAVAESASFTPSSRRGGDFFHRRQGDWSCATCHTSDPRSRGRHAVTGKEIAPLAPAANAMRFTDARRAEKWFRRNCRDVLGRECTSGEKADLISYLLSPMD